MTLDPRTFTPGQRVIAQFRDVYGGPIVNEAPWTYTGRHIGDPTALVFRTGSASADSAVVILRGDGWTSDDGARVTFRAERMLSAYEILAHMTDAEIERILGALNKPARYRFNEDEAEALTILTSQR